MRGENNKGKTDKDLLIYNVKKNIDSHQYVYFYDETHLMPNGVLLTIDLSLHCEKLYKKKIATKDGSSEYSLIRVGRYDFCEFFFEEIIIKQVATTFTTHKNDKERAGGTKELLKEVPYKIWVAAYKSRILNVLEFGREIREYLQNEITPELFKKAIVSLVDNCFLGEFDERLNNCTNEKK